MCRSRLLHTFLVFAMFVVGVTAVDAQTRDGGWASRGRTAATAAPPAHALAADDTFNLAQLARGPRAKSLVGTWRVSIPQSAGGLAPFNAYQTFNTDGTFTEVSDLLTTLTESPAHGVWSGKKLDYQLTFELFVFDPETKQPVGRVRVRCDIRLSEDGDSFAASSVVDFIAPDGSVAEAVDSGPFTATRVKVVPVNGT